MIEPPTPEKKSRVSLTKSQLVTASGAELLALCQTMTADGSLSEAEVGELRKWLEDNRSIDLPAKDFLHRTVEKILADGKVTPDERAELHKAIEAVLPPDLRREATTRRRTVAKGEQNRNSPISEHDFMVAGVHAEGRPRIVRQSVRAGDPAFLARDRSNHYSRNATEVRTQDGAHVGYVPEDDAVDMAPLLDQGCLQRAHFKKILTGGRIPIPVVVAKIYRHDAAVDGAIDANQVPPRLSVPPAMEPSARSKSGCLSVVVVWAITICLSALLVATLRW